MQIDLRRWIVLAALAGCTSKVREPAKEIAAEAKPDTDAQQWACTKDADCTQTCALGAVNRAWIAAHPELDTCDDGCGWKSGMTACRDAECVTLAEDGAVDPSCTKRPKPLD